MTKNCLGLGDYLGKSKHLSTTFESAACTLHISPLFDENPGNAIAGNIDRKELMGTGVILADPFFSEIIMAIRENSMFDLRFPFPTLFLEEKPDQELYSFMKTGIIVQIIIPFNYFIWPLIKGIYMGEKPEIQQFCRPIQPSQLIFITITLFVLL